jgi:hypothetical protein
MFAFVDGESFNSCIECLSISHTVASTLLVGIVTDLLVGFKTLMIASIWLNILQSLDLDFVFL